MRLFIISFCFSLALFSAEICQNSDLLSTEDIDELSSSIGKVVYNGDKLNGCTWDEQVSYYSSLKRVVDRLNVLIKQARNYDLSQIKGKSRRRAQKALKRLECMQEKSEKMEFRCVSKEECEGGRGTVAYVTWKSVSILGIIELDRTYPDRMINVCEGNLKRYKEEPFRDAIVSHELSHHCGADDLDYFIKVHSWRMPSSYLIDDWHQNADMYAYWYLHPFCVPGVDCDGHFFSEND